MLVCPGGMPGASNLAADPVLSHMLKEQFEQGRYVAAICAAPAVTLAPLGILAGRRATCYPGFEPQLAEASATHVAQRVVTDGNVITANGPSSAIPFALELITVLRTPKLPAPSPKAYCFNSISQMKPSKPKFVYRSAEIFGKEYSSFLSRLKDRYRNA